MDLAILLAQTLPLNSSWTQILLLIAGLVVAWIILRFVLRLASRIFSLGCALIVILAAILLALRYFGG
jgi:hypothetical protein